jgi:hypothetical protein
MSSLLIAALNEPVYATIDGKRRKITKRQAIITQMVNESASANLRATVRHDEGGRAAGRFGRTARA